MVRSWGEGSPSEWGEGPIKGTPEVPLHSFHDMSTKQEDQSATRKHFHTAAGPCPQPDLKLLASRM